MVRLPFITVSACPDPACLALNNRMVMVRLYPNRRTQYIWRGNQHRGNKVCLRSGSIFEASNLPWSKMIALLHYWSHDLSVKATVKLVGIDKKHVIYWHKKFRRVCRWWLARNPRQIGGLGVRVEIDEALIARRKYHR